MKPDLRIYRIPMLAGLAMIAALICWGAWSWEGYRERSQDWRRQSASDSFETLNAVIGVLGNGALTDWHQIEQVLASIIQNSRTQFVVVMDRHGRLAQIGNIPELPDIASPVGETLHGDLYLYWDTLRPVSLPASWTELENTNMTLSEGIWPSPIMVLGVRVVHEEFLTSWFWQRQGLVFASALMSILAVIAVWIAGLRRRAMAALLAAERSRSAHLEELGLAAAGLAHETKNPLGIIMGLAQRIAATPGVPAESRTMLEHIMDEVDKTTSRLGNFMAFARQREARMEAVDFQELCAELAEILGPDFESCGVRLIHDLPAQFILADPDMLRQILVNLLLNSLHASGSGATVSIAMIVQRHQIQITITDQGKGMTPELLAEIFKPYVSGSATGHGLGLAIVKRLVESQAWRIQVASFPGHGTTVTISGIKPALEQS